MPSILREKTNIDYLREYIKDNVEANEFLDAIVAEQDRLISEIVDASEEHTGLNDKISSLEGDVRDLTGKNYRNYIDAGIGHIGWEADALPLQSLMETLDEKLNLKRINPLKIENLLNAL